MLLDYPPPPLPSTITQSCNDYFKKQHSSQTQPFNYLVGVKNNSFLLNILTNFPKITLWHAMKFCSIFHFIKT